MHLHEPSSYPGDPNLDLQGPPGTGKTSAIIGMVSALLARNAEVAVQQQEQHAGKPHAVSWEGGGQGGSPDRDSSVPMARVLVCAQSNAAIDELIARLATPGLITPGRPAPASFTSALTAFCTLLHARCKRRRPLPHDSIWIQLLVGDIAAKALEGATVCHASQARTLCWPSFCCQLPLPQ